MVDIFTFLFWRLIAEDKTKKSLDPFTIPAFIKPNNLLFKTRNEALITHDISISSLH